MKKLAPWLLTGLLFSACTVKVPSKRFDNLLFNAGYINNVDTIIEKAEPEFSLYNLKQGEVIADIGAGSGWLEGYLMIVGNDLEIYAEDVDKRSIRNMPLIVNHYASLREQSQTNSVEYVRGNYVETRLPNSHFDKIILRETFHHFDDKDAMLTDIHLKLKCNGLLYLYEPRVEKTVYSYACESFHLKRMDMEIIFEKNGFVLEDAFELIGNPGNVPPWITLPKSQQEDKWILVFRKKQGCN